MATMISMFLLLAFLGCVVLYRDAKGKESDFMDMQATGCMRGVWCIIIVLVHVPADYQNSIQDALGSFAYIGVSFFFAMSGYGLVLGMQNKPEQICGFWKRRLPKLLIPMVMVNILRVVAELGATGVFDPLGFLHVNGFVRQLLLFYLIFWIVFRFLPKEMSLLARSNLICIVVAIISVLLYFLGENPILGWPVESLGFAYGILLARHRESFAAFAKKKWLLKCVVACGLSAAVGVTYLMIKNAGFLGDYVTKVVLGVCILLFIALLNTKLAFGNAVSRFLGKVSYEVYLVHDVVFLVLAMLWPQLDSGLFVVLSILITVILSFGINRMSKWLLKRKAR